MTVTAEDLRLIAEYARPLVGQRVSAARFGADSTLRLDFGPPLVRGPGGRRSRGQWRLWVLDAMWRLQTATEALVGSEDRKSKRVAVVQRLLERQVENVTIYPPALETIVTFSGDVQLRLFPVHRRDYQHWGLLTPDGHALDIGPGSTWAYRELPTPASSPSTPAN